jgi:hypothetical protein
MFVDPTVRVVTRTDKIACHVGGMRLVYRAIELKDPAKLLRKFADDYRRVTGEFPLSQDFVVERLETPRKPL